MGSKLRARITVDSSGRIIGTGGAASMIGAREASEWGNRSVEVTIEDREGNVIKRETMSVNELYKKVRRGVL